MLSNGYVIMCLKVLHVAIVIINIPVYMSYKYEFK